MNVAPSHLALLKTLSETCRNSQKSYEVVAREVQNLAVKSLLEEFAAQHSQFAMELRHLAQALGGADVNGHSIDSLVLPAELSVPTLFSTQSDEHAILAECELVEAEVLAEYRDALQNALPGVIHSTVLEQFESLLASQARLEAVKEAAGVLVAE